MEYFRFIAKNRLCFSLLVFLFSVGTTGCAQRDSTYLPLDMYSLPARIAFGSCADQSKPQGVLNQVVAHQPDLFIYLGDNIYGDTENMVKLRKKYEKLRERPEFEALKAACPILATWDDHDFGENDAGRHYPKKEESKEIFLDFWGEPTDSDRRKHAGIYTSYMLEDKGHALQIILLDTRTFRDNLISCDGGECKNDYMPNPSPDSTFLGETQWNWLEKQLYKRATVRIIASSNQFSHAYNGWESWTNVPHERQRMMEMIADSEAESVIFLSGDVHWGEISRLESPVLRYPLWDVTSSGINRDWDKVEPNENRVGEPVPEFNFGLLEIDWKADPVKITMKLVDESGKVRNEAELTTEMLR